MATPHANGANNANGNSAARSQTDQGNSAARRRPWDILENGGISPDPRPSPFRQAHNAPTVDEALNIYEKQYFPYQPKSLSGIAARSLAVGIVFSLSFQATLALLVYHNSFWRAPFFISSLAVFHFLEFWITAAYNTPTAQISSFLFTGNGSAYNIAHSTAFLECVIRTFFFPGVSIYPKNLHTPMVILGLGLIVMGQTIRSIAMKQAGMNFNHIVQAKKAQSHKLVTHGIYGYLRHPSYFGFFWWGLGTQLVLGNPICFVGYLVVLWKFFHRRISGEEELLVRFFGDEYVQYRKRTTVGIPFL